MYTMTIELPSDDADDGDAVSPAEVWLAACLAAPCPPLWATLARDALALGWPRDGLREPGHRVRSIVAVAAALANDAGAPASDRLDADSLTYTTVSETVIRLDGQVLTIGGAAASVLRRALAAAELAGVRYVADAALVDAALAEVGERAATLTRSRLQTDVASAAARGQRYEADDSHIVVELDSPNGPRVTAPADADADDILAALPVGWTVHPDDWQSQVTLLGERHAYPLSRDDGGTW